MSVDEFYDMTPKEYDYAIEDDWQLRINKERRGFEAARLVCVTIRNAQITRLRHEIRDPSEYMPFPWEKKEQSQNDIKERLLLFAQMHNRSIDKKKAK